MGDLYKLLGQSGKRQGVFYKAGPSGLVLGPARAAGPSTRQRGARSRSAPCRPTAPGVAATAARPPPPGQGREKRAQPARQGSRRYRATAPRAACTPQSPQDRCRRAAPKMTPGPTPGPMPGPTPGPTPPPDAPSRLGPAMADAGRTRPSSANLGSESAISCPTSARFDQSWAHVGQNCPEFDQDWPNLSRQIRPILALNRPTLTRHRPNLGRFRPSLALSCPTLAGCR